MKHITQKYLSLIIFLIFVTNVMFVLGQTNNPQVLQPNQTIEREMTGAETHRYNFELKANEFFQVRVEQKGVDIALKLLDSEGKTLATMDSPNGTEGPETLSFVAEQTGSFVLELIGFDANAKNGNYTLKSEAARTATSSDKRRIAVEKLFVEGMTARDTQGQSEISLNKLEEALQGWRELKVEYLVNLTSQQVNQLKATKAKTIFDEAFVLFQQGKIESYKPAFEKFQEVSRLYLEINDKSEKPGISLLVSGLISKNLGNNLEALKFFKQALLFFQTNKYQKAEAATLKNLSLIYNALGDRQKALEFFNQALPLFKLIGDKLSEAKTLNDIGLIYNALGDRQKALEFFNQALPLFKLFDDKLSEAATLNNIGLVYKTLGDRQKALEFYNQALPLFKLIGDKSSEAKTLNNIGSVYKTLGEMQKALEFYNQALPLFKLFDDKSSVATNLNNIGTVHKSLGENQKALEFYNQALLIFKLVFDKSGEASTFNNIGLVYDILGEKQKALEFYNRALPLFKLIGDKAGEAATLNNIGLVYNDLGEKQKALEFYNRALPFFKLISDKASEAVTLNNIGTVYDDLGEKQKALEFYNQALPLRQLVGDKFGEAATLNNIGLVKKTLGDKKNALEFLNQALQLSKLVGDKFGEAAALNNIGSVYRTLGENQKALDFYNQALTFRKLVGDKAGEAATLNNIGSIYNTLGENQKASESFNQAFILSKTVGYKSGEAKTLNNNMYVSESLDNIRLAVFNGKQSVNLYQQLRLNVKNLDKGIQKSFINSISDTYKKLAQIMLDQNRVEEALQVLSLFKEEEFLDAYRQQNARDKVIGLALTQHEKEAEERFQIISNKLSALGSQITVLENNKNRTSDEEQKLAKLNSEFKAESDNLQKLFDSLAVEFSKPTEKDKPPQVPEIAVLQDNLRQLNKTPKTKAVAIYTLIGSDKFYVLLVTPNKPVIARSYNIKGEDLLKKINDYRNVLQNPSDDPEGLAAELYQIIVKPIEKELDASKANTLMWSLDGQLRYIPPATLFDASRKEYLIQRYRNVLFTPAGKTDLSEDKTTNQVWKGLGLGVSQLKEIDLYGKSLSFPPLANVLPEIRGIIRLPGETAGIYQGKRLENPRFSTDTFKSELKNKYKLVHIASHFYFNNQSPIESFLLTGMGKLSLAEMLETPKFFEGIELLTLSACQTAIGKNDSNGKEIEGFAVLAQQQGAKAIIATLWSVNDESTAKIMQSFYRIYNSSTEMNKSEALRQAQLKYLKEADRINDVSPRSDIIDLSQNPTKPFTKERTKHPYYWAPFILYGNWK